jgi:hypothetical protein
VSDLDLENVMVDRAQGFDFCRRKCIEIGVFVLDWGRGRVFQIVLVTNDPSDAFVGKWRNLMVSLAFGSLESILSVWI